MTKKDFIAIANTLNANHADFALVSDFADMCAKSNPLFDRARFITAASSNIREDALRVARMLDRAEV